jgi:hypothetical protein
VRQRDPEAGFVGRVTDDAFTLRPVLVGYWNSFAPIAFGSVKTGAAGTHVDVSMRLPRTVAALVTGWLALIACFVIVGLFVAMSSPSRAWFTLVALGMLAVGWGGVSRVFGFEAGRMRDNLTRVINSGAPASELRRVDLDWLSLRPRDGDPVDRRFNRVFLAGFAAAAVVGVLGWERVAGACSNAEYRHRDTISCPGDVRIAALWASVVVVIGACFASRLALHRRARWAYGPLLVVVVLAGVAAGWLAMQHPRWGVPR